MNEAMKSKMIDLAASYYANQVCEEAAAHYEAAKAYGNKFEGAVQMAALVGIEEAEIKEYAWRKWGQAMQEAADELHYW